MTVRETFLFIHRPLSKLAASPLRAVSLNVDDQLVHLYGGGDAGSATFGLAADNDEAPDNEWTQLLHSDPQDFAALARSLRTLGVRSDELVSATNWEGAPLVDLKLLKQALDLEYSDRSETPLRGGIGKNDLIALVADKAGLTRAQAGEAVDAVFDAITSALKKGENVRLVGFGSFAVSKRAASVGRSVATGAEIKIPASNQAKFKPGKGLKDAIN